MIYLNFLRECIINKDLVYKYILCIFTKNKIIMELSSNNYRHKKNSTSSVCDIELNLTGSTYSVVNPNIYDIYKETKDGELFEELVRDLILNKYSDCVETNKYILSLPKRDQRLAIMSLIDKETKGDANLLWSEMKAYVDTRTDKMDHVKDVIRIINKFVKDGTVEKKSHGEVMTPITLVREMIDTLPKEVWSNPHLKWLDPCNGAGTFPFVVIYKLMNGLKDWEPDVEKRYKHIVENMIYVCELQSRNVFLWLCGVDPYDEYTTNTYWGSFLDEGFDKHMKEVWGVDKFDIVIGNPPYQNGKDSNFYVKFIDKFFKISKEGSLLSFIVPNRFFQPSHKAHKSISKYNVKTVYHNLNDYFPTVSTHIGSFLLENKLRISSDVLCVFKDEEAIIDFDTPLPTDVRLSSIKYKKLLDKILNKYEKLEFKKERGDIYVKRQWRRWNSITGLGGDHVFNTILEYNIENDGNDGKWISCDDIEKMDWYLSKSNLIRFITKMFASAMNVPPFVWTIIPKINLSEVHNNSDVYNLFDLNDDEIKMIESNIK